MNGVVNLKTSELHFVYDTNGAVVCMTEQDVKDLLPIGTLHTSHPKLCQLCWEWVAYGGDPEFDPSVPEDQRKKKKRRKRDEPPEEEGEQ